MSASEQLVAEDAKKSPEELKKQTSVTDENRFISGVSLKGKLFGVETVKKETGDEICNEALVKLRAVLTAKKEHKQPVNLKISVEGIEITDQKTSAVLYKHLVNRISYISRDVKDSRAIGYIYKTSATEFHYFGIRTAGQAIEFFNILKDLFETVLEMNNAKKKNAADATTPTEAKPAESAATPAANSVAASATTPVATAPVQTEPTPAPKPKPEPVPVTPITPPVDSLFDMDTPEPPIPVKQEPAVDLTSQLFDMSISEPPAPAETQKKKEDDWMNMLETPTPIISTPTGNIYATNQPNVLLGNSLLNPSQGLIQPNSTQVSPLVNQPMPPQNPMQRPMNPQGQFSQPPVQNQFQQYGQPMPQQYAQPVPQQFGQTVAHNPYAAFSTIQHFNQQQPNFNAQPAFQPMQQAQPQIQRPPLPNNPTQPQKFISPAKQQQNDILNNNLFGGNAFAFNK